MISDDLKVPRILSVTATENESHSGGKPTRWRSVLAWLQLTVAKVVNNFAAKLFCVCCPTWCELFPRDGL